MMQTLVDVDMIGQPTTETNKLEVPKKKDNRDLTILNLPKLGLNKRKPTTDGLNSLGIFTSSPAEARRGEDGRTE
jgi:hypothetical protein